MLAMVAQTVSYTGERAADSLTGFYIAWAAASLADHRVAGSLLAGVTGMIP